MPPGANFWMLEPCEVQWRQRLRYQPDIPSASREVPGVSVRSDLNGRSEMVRCREHSAAPRQGGNITGDQDSSRELVSMPKERPTTTDNGPTTHGYTIGLSVIIRMPSPR